MTISLDQVVSVLDVAAVLAAVIVGLIINASLDNAADMEGRHG